MEDRVNKIKDGCEDRGEYVLYWMQNAQRTKYNHSLEYSILEANRLEKPLVVIFNLFSDYPEANYRHYYFMIEGLFNLKENFQKRNIEFLVIYGDLVTNISGLAEKAVTLITDKGYLKTEKRWRHSIAENIRCLMIEVETNLIVPIKVTSKKEEYAARTIRPKIKKFLGSYLYDFQYETYNGYTKEYSIVIDTLKNKWKDKLIPLDDSPKQLTDSLNLNKEVDRVKSFIGGEDEASKRLDTFIEEALDRYDDLSSSPEKDNVSHLSPYLHFGNISPIEIAQRILKERSSTNKEAISGFLEELIIRRELSFNFVYYNDSYDTWEGITYPWAYDTLKLHSTDKREYLYSLEEFEDGKTHDIYWNAAQNEMLKTGFMHGYMRMYWCKKILEWSSTPKKAYETALYLNNKYFLDGRDPNSYTGVAWCFGKHDRGWKEREIYGKVRCMMASGLKRKFKMKDYIDRVNNL